MTFIEAIKEVSDSVIKDAKTNLRGMNHIATGSLRDSLTYNISRTKNGITIAFEGNDYAEYVDGGVRPAGEEGSERTKMPPIDNIKSWCKRKGITDEGAAYAIQRSIFKNGSPSKNGKRLPPSLFFTNALNDNMDGYNDAVDAYFDEIEEQFDIIFK